MSHKRQLHPTLDHLRGTGAFVTLEHLLKLRLAAKSLELAYNSRSRLGMSGVHISKIKGRGVDFEEFRGYQPGDDIRLIDWRATARLGRPFVKVFREERERPVIIGVDQGRGMFFGSKVAFKSVIACEAAAIICWTTVDAGDRVGGVVFSGQGLDLVKPRRSKRSALRFLNALATFNQALVQGHRHEPTGGGSLLAALEQIYRITKPGSNVYLISDFQQMDEKCRHYLQQLALHNSVTCLFVFDPLEENLPLPGVYSITDGRERSTIDTYSNTIRHLYSEQFHGRVAQLESEFTKMKIPLITLRTDQAVLEQLDTWKHRIR